MTILCDLDGVIYRGREVLPGVRDALARVEAARIPIFYITNNSTRTPAQGAEKIEALAGVSVTSDQVLGSSLAAVGLLGPDDGPVFVVGEDGVSDAVVRAGLDETSDATRARTVLVGLTRSFSYELLGDAMAAVRGGARFVATNDDATFPTEDGLMPGAGTIVAALAKATGRDPEVAGKPHRPMRDLIRSRGVGSAWVIGDRLDTDIAMADGEPDWRSILVLTGVTTSEEAKSSDADHVVPDFAAAVDLVLAVDHPS